MASESAHTHPEEAVVTDFDSLLTLEQDYCTEGYNLGLTDGARAGRIEGRVFGLEKGFDKHLELGRLGGRAAIWRSRVSEAQNPTSEAKKVVEGSDAKVLEGNARLEKHLNRLSDLTDPATLSTENSEDAVEEYEGRVKDAKAKATLISRMLGEETSASGSRAAESRASTDGLKSKQSGAGRGTGEMEDFVGVPAVRTMTDK